VWSKTAVRVQYSNVVYSSGCADVVAQSRRTTVALYNNVFLLLYTLQTLYIAE